MLSPATRGRLLALGIAGCLCASSVHAKMITGHYVGDGTASQIIAGLGFQPAVVIVKGDLNKDATIRTSAMPAGVSKPLVGNAGLLPNLILSLDAGGFTVGSAQAVNESGTDYYWAAFEDEPGVLKVGTYAGDGSANHVISGIGFRPGFIISMSEGAQEAVFRLPVTIPSFDFDKDGGGGNLLTTPVLDDLFRTGSDARVNQSGVTYYYVCWTRIAGYVDFGGYSGDGNDDRDLTQPGFKPEYVIVRNSEGDDTSQRFGAMGAVDEAAFFATISNGTNHIQALTADGFQVGSSSAVNGNGDFIMYAAFGRERTFVITGRVFEDANFAGTASAYDGGVSDKALPGVDVELYDAVTDAYITSTTTDASGNYSFVGLVDSSYKVRVRSATLGSAAASPKGGLNGTVPATWPYPLAEMTWGNGAALYGGQSANVDDAATGDNAGPGDTYVTVNVSGADVTGVDFGFAYNLIVNTADDANANNLRSQQGSLRQFIKNANAIAATGGTTASSSQFRIPGGGPHTIQPVQALPAIDDSLVLDGYTQPGAQANTVPSPGATDAVLLVELDGIVAGVVIGGLRITGGGSTVRGLVIKRFDGDGIRIESNGGNFVEGNYVGTDSVGATARANTKTGVLITSAGNTIGGASPAARNVISGNTQFGVKCSGTSADNNSILGNYLGVTASGTASLTNIESAVEISDGADNDIGNGSAGNVINGRVGRYGISIISGAATGNSIQGNFIGTNASGNAKLSGGTHGIYIFTGASTTVGGTGPNEGNVIAGYLQAGISTTGNGTIIEGNAIGTDAAGTLDLTTGADGIRIGAGVSGATIGGTAAGAGNVIAFNSDNGIEFAAGAASGNLISRNRIYSNGALGIDLSTNGVTTNDLNDADSGPNDLFNFPVIDTAAIVGPNLVLSGWARPGAVIELFVADGDTSGFGEGEDYVLTLTEGGSGSGGEDPYLDTDTTSSSYGPGAINGLLQGQDTAERFRFIFPKPGSVAGGTLLAATGRSATSSTSEFSGVVAAGDASCTIAGRVFEDADYGGGAGRTLAASSGVVRPAARVELYDAGGAFVTATVTDGAGAYLFNGLPPGTYYVRVVVGTVTSSRTGYTPTAAPVQTYRTDASGGAAAPVTNQVGGTNPALVDPGNGGPGTVLNTTTYEFTAGLSGTAQSVAPVVVSAAAVALSGARSGAAR